MPFCEKCGTQIDDNEQFCSNCGTKAKNSGSAKKFCESCGKEVNENAVVCPNCGVSVKSKSPNKLNKKAILSAILSAVIPGLGQFYLRFKKKGAIFLVLAVVSVVLTNFIIGRFIYPFVWVLAVYDAYNSAELLSVGIELEDKISANIW